MVQKQFLVFVFAMGMLLAQVMSTNIVQAAGPEWCKSYAQEAVSQANLFYSRNCRPIYDRPDRQYDPNVWSTDDKLHYDWCLKANIMTTFTGLADRDRDLRYCKSVNNVCDYYAKEALKLRDRAVEKGGKCIEMMNSEPYVWSSDYRIHFDWCKGLPDQQVVEDFLHMREKNIYECSK